MWQLLYFYITDIEREREDEEQYEKLWEIYILNSQFVVNIFTRQYFRRHAAHQCIPPRMVALIPLRRRRRLIRRVHRLSIVIWVITMKPRIRFYFLFDVLHRIYRDVDLILSPNLISYRRELLGLSRAKMWWSAERRCTQIVPSRFYLYISLF